MEQKTLTDALERAAGDPEFAVQLMRDPSEFRDEFDLTDEQLDAISAAGSTGGGSGNNGTNNGLNNGQYE